MSAFEFPSANTVDENELKEVKQKYEN